MSYNNYDDIISLTKSSDALSMYKLSQLYDAGIIDYDGDENYILGAKKIAESNDVNSIIELIDIDDFGILLEDVYTTTMLDTMKNVFIEIGLYYMYSSYI